jgi:hypothetical protein
MSNLEKKEGLTMKSEWIRWTAAMALGLSLITTGCGEKKGESGTSPSPVGPAPSAPPEKTGTDDTVQPGGGPEQSPSGTIREQNTEGERKSQRK